MRTSARSGAARQRAFFARRKRREQDARRPHGLAATLFPVLNRAFGKTEAAANSSRVSLRVPRIARASTSSGTCTMKPFVSSPRAKAQARRTLFRIRLPAFDTAPYSFAIIIGQPGLTFVKIRVGRSEPQRIGCQQAAMGFSGTLETPQAIDFIGAPNRTRTGVSALRGPRPGPLDDGSERWAGAYNGGWVRLASRARRGA